MTHQHIASLSSFLEDLQHMFEQNPNGLNLDAELVAFFRDAMQEAIGISQGLELAASVLDDMRSPRPPKRLLTTPSLRRERVLASMEIPGTSIVVLPYGQLPPKPAFSDGHDRGGAA